MRAPTIFPPIECSSQPSYTCDAIAETGVPKPAFCAAPEALAAAFEKRSAYRKAICRSALEAPVRSRACASSFIAASTLVWSLVSVLFEPNCASVCAMACAPIACARETSPPVSALRFSVYASVYAIEYGIIALDSCFCPAA